MRGSRPRRLGAKVAPRGSDVTLDELTGGLPPPRRIEGARARLRADLARSGRKLVVLDDDPTGTQTVHGVKVYMDWSEGTLEGALQAADSAFYVSTNSRSLAPDEAESLAALIGRNLRDAARRLGAEVLVASRSDSTLRGHFPVEVSALASALYGAVDGVILAPCFFEAGRYTVGDVQWVETAGELVEAHRTEFARDRAFGYRSSDLKEWVAEKSAGAIPSSRVISIRLDLLRSGGEDYVAEALARSKDGSPIIANAACYEDLEILAGAVARVESAGKRFIYRTAASFVKARAGIEDRPFLTREETQAGAGPGLVVVGSYIGKTTRQVKALLDAGLARGVELGVDELDDGRSAEGEVARVAREAASVLSSGSSVAVYTSRTLRETSDSIAAGKTVMSALCDAVRRIDARPSWIVAKGGITSIEIARSALRAATAEVLGQIASGVSVWRTGPPAVWGEVPYVVFPGNVGGDEALLDVVRALSGR